MDDENVYELVPTVLDDNDKPRTIIMTFQAPHMNEPMTRTATGYLVQMGFNVGVSSEPETSDIDGVQFLIPGAHLLVIDFADGEVN